MTLKNELIKLGHDEINRIKNDFTRIRKFCIDYKIAPARFYEIIEEVEEETRDILKSVGVAEPEEAKKRVSKVESKRKARARKLAKQEKEPSTPYHVIVEAFKNYRNRVGVDSQIDFSSLVSEIKVDLDKRGMQSGLVCPLEGLVAKTLYDFAENEELGEHDRAMYRGVGINRQVQLESLEKILKVKLDEKTLRKLVGIIDRDYVEKHYIFDEESVSIKYKDREGNLHSNPNVEGEICWNGLSKNETHNKLVNYVKDRLLPALRTKASAIDTEKRNLERNLSAKKEEVRMQEKESERRQKNLQEITYTFEAVDEKSLRSLRRHLVQEVTGKARASDDDTIPGVELRIGSKTGKAYMTATIKSSSNRTPRNTFLNAWDRITRRKAKGVFGGVSENIADVNDSLRKNSREVDSLSTEKQSVLLEISKIERKVAEVQNARKEALTVSYLGLEGPNFGSFLKLYNAIAKESGMNMEGFFAEYDLRAFNLMKSIIGNMKNYKGDEIKLFEDYHLEGRNLEEWILLDFVKDSDLKLSTRSTPEVVKFKNEELTLRDYEYLIDQSNKEEPVKELASAFSISQEFVRAALNRHDKKFDVVFLDYVGSPTERKLYALEQLVKNRLNDEAVVAVTLSKRFQQKGMVIDEGAEAIRRAGYEVQSNAPIELHYKDRTIEMAFHIYHVRKRKD